MANFLHLPNEIIHMILAYISPDDILLKVQRVCRVLRFLARDNRLWKTHCKSITYWSPHHNIKDKLNASLMDTNWKNLYILRKKRNREADRLMSKIVATRSGRMLRLEQISMLGLDVKQYLLDQMTLSFLKHEYALARRFHASVSLASMHRAMAISRWLRFSPHKITGNPLEITSQWQNYAKRPWAPGDLEELMTGLDMFALTRKDRDMSWSSEMLDRITDDFKADNSDFDMLSTRQKAIRINMWLRHHTYVGTKAQERAFYYLRCTYLGQALAYDDHMSIPLIQCVIYCCVAARLGLNANCCMYPGQLHVIVHAPEGEYLDGRRSSNRPAGKDERRLVDMILSPYDQDHESNMQLMETMMSPFTMSPGSENILQPMHPVDVLLRHARNIRTGCEQIRRMPVYASQQASTLTDSTGYNNVLTSAYAALWIQVLFTPQWEPEWKSYAVELLNTVRTAWPEDYWIMQRFFPPYDAAGKSQTRIGPHSLMTTMTPYRPSDIEQQRDNQKVKPSLRDKAGGPARYRVGQVFKHRRYGSIGVITGWMQRQMCQRVESMTTDNEHSVRTETVSVVYYYCLAGNNALPVCINEEYIALINDPEKIPMELLNRCGKYFKNFNVGRCEFISNVTDEFPED